VRVGGAALAAVAVGAVAAGAQPGQVAPASAEAGEPLRVTLAPPPALTPGVAAEVVATVVGADPGAPLLLTPVCEGSAVDAVRGRLLREDADPEVGPDGDEAGREGAGRDRVGRDGAPPRPALRFRVPVLARAPGTSVLRVRVSTWRCAARCRAVEADASVVLRVERPGSGGP
jgi:hypothetical protein